MIMKTAVFTLAATLAVAATQFIALSGCALASPAVLNAAPTGTTIPVPATVPFVSGPQETLAQCMGYWDAGTHMSKAEWRRACQRTQDGTMF
jgi:hypothetical protein